MIYTSKTQLKFISLIASGCLLVGLASTTQAQTASSPAPQPEPKSIIYNPPQPPSDQGTPVGRRQGGASRGACKDYEGLTALMPIQNGTVKGITSASEPTLLFYVPAPLTSDKPMELVLQDPSDNYVYQTQLTLETDRAGLISIPVRPDPDLVDSTSYYWTLSIYCDPESPSASVHVNGLLDYRKPAKQMDAKGSIKDSSPESRATVFQQAQIQAQEGIWIDSLINLAQLRQTHPNDLEIAQAWAELLRQGDLTEFSSSVIIPNPE